MERRVGKDKITASNAGEDAFDCLDVFDRDRIRHRAASQESATERQVEIDDAGERGE